MRIAVIADIHGNLAAFHAALDHLAARHVDRLVIAGDIVNGSPDSQACWRLATSLGCPIVRGNHERYVSHYGTEHAHPSWETPQYGPVHWAVAQCTAEERAAMGVLPLGVELEEAPGLLIVHASPRGDHDTVAAYTPDADMAAMFDSTAHPLVVRAHNHAPNIRLWRGRKIVTTGSVGLALDGNPAAQYLTLTQRGSDWQIEHHAVRYDVDAAARRFYETGYLEQAGPIARLFLREVVTGAHQLVPFLRAFERWNRETPIALDAALDRFLQIR